MSAIADIESYMWDFYPTSGGADIQWLIRNVGGEAGTCWTELYNTTLHIGLYHSTDYYASGEGMWHWKWVDVPSGGSMFSIKAGHYQSNNKVIDDEAAFYISGLRKR